MPSPGARARRRTRRHAPRAAASSPRASGSDVGDVAAQHLVAQRRAARERDADRRQAEPRGIAVERDEAKVVLVSLGDVGELHAEQLARRGERTLDRGVRAFARDAGERVERSGRRPDGVEDAVDAVLSAPARPV